MKLKIIYERSVNVLASTLAIAAQRLPFLKNFSPLLHSAGSVKFAAPLTVTFVGTHALSGQSATVRPVNGGTDTIDLELGESFVWSFTVDAPSLGTFSVELDNVEALPPGVQKSGPQSKIGTLGGTPTEAGSYIMKIIGWRFGSFSSQSTQPYFLTLNVTGEAASPFDTFLANFWSGDDLANPNIVGPNKDPDGDGMDNLLEFVLDLDPKVAGVQPSDFKTDPNDPSKFLYEVPLNSAASDSTVIFQEALTGNGDWANVDATQFTRSADSIILSVPKATKKFYRLKVTL